ncbi:MAG: GNAT family N-acetyltransferase [Chloroflexota bacterium]
MAFSSFTGGQLRVETVTGVEAVGQAEWDRLSAGRPFASYRWYRYGETVMDDCRPVYILVERGGEAIARATFWLVRNEPLPVEPKTVRSALQAYLRRRPLLICRSPLANLSGLILPEQNPADCLRLIAEAAKSALRELKGSFLLFDFMEAGRDDWPADFVPHQVSDPGTVMAVEADSFEDYLAGGNKKDRQHYKRVLRQAEELGLELTRHARVPDLDEAMPLIRNVERRHNAAENQWVRGMLAHIDGINAAWLEVRQHGRLVGCGLLAEDNGALMATALGLAEDAQYAYFLLVYATLQEGFERRVKAIRMGSGAYEVKQRLGFELERNNHAFVWLNTPALRKLLGR